MKHSMLVLASAALTLTAGQAAADDGSWGLIGGLSRGGKTNSSVSETVTLGGTPALFTITGESEDPSGYLFGIVWDTPANDHWTLGGELTYRQNSFDIDGRISASAGGTTDVIDAGGDGSVHTIAAMINAWRYSGAVGDDNRFFAGLGIGAAHGREDASITASGTLLGTPINNVTSLDESATSFAWQIGAGWDFAMTESSRGSISYRYFDAGRIDQIETATHSIVFGVHF